MSKSKKVWFVGAGPGAVDLITVRGAQLLESADLVLYAGSLVDDEILSYCSPEAVKINTARLTLEEQTEIYKSSNCSTVVRLHSGDPTIYGAIAEQIEILESLGLDYEIVPGVSSFTAAAAAQNIELTKPNCSQTIILTRYSGRASKVPELENLAGLASHQASLCLFLSGSYLKEVVDELLNHYSAETPILLAYKSTWPDERYQLGKLSTILSEIKPAQWKLTTMVIVGAVIDNDVNERSSLYSPTYSHRFRKANVRRH